MQLRLLASVVIYLASYLPLSVILLCQDLDFARVGGPFCNPFYRVDTTDCALPFGHPWAALGTVAACGLALAVTAGALKLADPKRKIVIHEAKHTPADLMNYVLPYVVSFMGIEYADRGKLLGFLVFFIWIFLITHKSGQVILNPVLTILGWRLYEVKYIFEGGSDIYSGVALSRVVLHQDAHYRQTGIQDVLIIKASLDGT